MVDKEELVMYIKEWIGIDNKLKEVQKIAKQLREQKKEISSYLVNIMKDNEIDCFDVNDGKLLYKQNKVKQSLSKKHLLKTLAEYFEDDRETAISVAKFILDSREEKVNDVIKKKDDKLL